ncbi:MAG: HAMP domain-containing protein [Anaerolineales bacterium]|nr:HAMP domain-containing protein [Anaerolineales bacterium]MCW5839085.1 HAMP domain-containing protein [Anaerolineales bacterium]
MSLRTRLTLYYTLVLAAVLVLFGLAVYGLISVVQLRQVDSALERAARDLLFVARVDEQGDIIFIQRVSFDSSVISQVWNTSGQLVGVTQTVDPQSPLMQPLDASAMQADERTFTDVTISNIPYRVLSVPLHSNGQRVGVLQSGASLSIFDALRADLVRYLALLSAIAILIAGMLGLVTGRRALAPLATITDTALQITRADDLSRRIPPPSDPEDEVGRLITAFNDTLARLEKLFTTQRRFVADIGHELRTPLTVVRGNLDLMRRIGKMDEESMHSIEQEVVRLSRLVEDLLVLAQAESGKLPMDRRRVELDSLLLEVFNQVRVLAGDSVKLEIGKIDQVLVCGDRDRLRQVVLNLVANAIKYTKPGGVVTASLSKDAQEAKLAVRDTGLGIPAADLPHVFERFYRGDKSRSRGKDGAGFGLGLSIAYWIVRNHRGEIEVKSRANRGSTFTIRLPLADENCPDTTSDLRLETTFPVAAKATPPGAPPEHID